MASKRNAIYGMPLTDEQRTRAEEALPWVRRHLESYAATRLPRHARDGFVELAGVVCVRLAQEYRPDSPASWRGYYSTYALARALDIDGTRRRKVARHHISISETDEDETDGNCGWIGADEPGYDAVDARDAVEHLLRRLDAQEAAALRLTVLGDMPDVEARLLVPRLATNGRAIRYGVSRGRVGQLRQRALAVLRETLGCE